jgi:hypothetical protein
MNRYYQFDVIGEELEAYHLRISERMDHFVVLIVYYEVNRPYYITSFLVVFRSCIL